MTLNRLRQWRQFVMNRYALTGLLGLLWVTFISDISLPFIVMSQWELNGMEAHADQLQKNIASLEKQLEDWSNSEHALERYARETYYMKKPNEEVFRVVDQEGRPIVTVQ